ncbi:hypothetical protein Dsin_003911 [Dipteronia sinensis]|uniref:MLO-like protein n=1 Tax=Dipteronia sinensis TaxID=43782 RepID=A0AAE0EMK9_9ROSI|nr:hypothetical protein Dsin_003911 [Dipteronia sinensis]
MAGGATGERSLMETPTWAVAVVCALFVILSILIEHGIQSLGKWFQKRQKKAMIEALEKIKAELMLLGFISLLLTVGSTLIYKICIPARYGKYMLPCEDMTRRVLAAGAVGGDYCSNKGKISLISQSGMHQLHIFIFVLAVLHVLYSVVTIALAKAKMHKWKAWESETSSFEYQFTNDPSRFRLTHQTSFVKRHSGFSKAPGIRWIVAFFRQFLGSVTKVDYLTMRHGFINYTSLDFCCNLFTCKRIQIILVFELIYNINYVQILLLVGTKLELVIMEMAEKILEKTTVVRGAPVVEPNNKYFWFNRPHWILFLIHYTLFQNAFQMALFLWTVYEFGLTSCFHENLVSILVRVFLGMAIQILCSYITFPLYALVTQMGSHMKQAIFEEQTAKAIKKWQKAAKERRKLRKEGGGGGGGDHSTVNGSSPSPSQGGTSPLYLLHNHQHRSNQPDIESVAASPTATYYNYPSDTELSEIELGDQPRNNHDQDQHHHLNHNNHNFSFDKR